MPSDGTTTQSTPLTTENHYGFGDERPVSLNEVLMARAAADDPGHPFITWLEDGEQDAHPLSFKELRDRSLAVADLLLRSGLDPGDRVMVMLPSGLEFITTFFGTQLAGLVPVPVYPPTRLARLEHYLRTLTAIADTADCRAALADERVIPVVGSRLLPRGGALLSDRQLKDASGTTTPARLTPATACFLQFTSGTTSRPKGVLLQQEQVMAQLDSYARALALKPGEPVVSWLPLYHDLGLIGKVLASLYVRAHLVLMSPVHFLKKPLCWLQAISRYRAVHSAAPNFAYQLSVRKCPAETCRRIDLDLSSWENAGMGGESVSMATVEAFRRHFEPFGFDPKVLNPCYGLAENTLVASGHRRGEPLRSRRLSRQALTENRVAPPEDESDAFELPSNGKPFPGMAVEAVGDGGEALAEAQIGELQIAGPSLAAGYFNDGEATRQTFVERAGRRWLKTGDLGFIWQGDVYVCGRAKDLLIVRGRNFHPQDLEQVATGVDGVRPGNVVAFSASTGGGPERAVLVAELDPRAGREADEVRQDIVEAISSAFELRLDEVRLVPKGTIPKTSSGKLQRSLCQQAFENGELARFQPPGRIEETLLKLRIGAKTLLRKLRPGRVPKASQEAHKPRRTGPLDPRLEEVLAEALDEGLPAGLHQGLRLDALGLDSLARMELWMEAERRFESKVPDGEWMESQTLGDLQELLERYQGTRPPSEADERTVPPLFEKLLETRGKVAHQPDPVPFTAPLMFGTLAGISRWVWGFDSDGQEHLPEPGQSFILAGNHQTYLDAAWLRGALPPAYRSQLSAISWAHLPLFTRAFLRQMDTIPVDPKGSSRKPLQDAIAALEAGRLLVVFPEGARTYNGRIDTFRPGVAIVSLIAQRPIVPFRIHRGFDIFPRDRSFPSFWPRWQEEQQLRIRFGAPIVPPQLVPERGWEQARELLAEVKAAVSAL